jgi:DNA-binding transcriptional MerR regulator
MRHDSPDSRSSTRNLTLDDLVANTGFSVRQIRYYISQDLVPGAAGRGPSATYGSETLRRLQLIKALKQMAGDSVSRQLTLEEIRRVLAYMSVQGPDLGLAEAVQRSILDSMPLVAREPSLTDALYSPEAAVESKDSIKRNPDKGDRWAGGSALDYIDSLKEEAKSEEPPEEFEIRAMMSFQPLDAQEDPEPQPMNMEMVSESRADTLGTLRPLFEQWLDTLRELSTEPVSHTKDPNPRPASWRRITADDPYLFLELHVGQPASPAQRERLLALTLHLKRLLNWRDDYER